MMQRYNSCLYDYLGEIGITVKMCLRSVGVNPTLQNKNSNQVGFLCGHNLLRNKNKAGLISYNINSRPSLFNFAKQFSEGPTNINIDNFYK
jgi:hypothetical protein